MINTKLQSIIDTKSAIGNAIVNKGGTITSETPFFNYAAQIDGISTGGGAYSTWVAQAQDNSLYTVYNGYDATTNPTPNLSNNFAFNRWLPNNSATGDIVLSNVVLQVGGNFNGPNIVANEANMAFVNNTASYGGSIFSVTTNNGFIYAGGAGSGGNTRTVQKFHESNLAFVGNTSAYGSFILSITTNNGFIFVGGGDNQPVRKYREDNLAITANSSNYFYTTTLHTNNGFVYAGGYGPSFGAGNLAKYHESNLTFVANSASYGGFINAITTNNGFVYVGGATSPTIKKYHESNLAFVSNSNGLGFIATLIVNNNFIYALTSVDVKKFHESNFALVGNTVSYGNSTVQMTLNNGFIFVGGQPSPGNNRGVAKYHESNLVRVGNTANYGGIIQSVTTNNGFIYAGGDTNNTVQKFYEIGEGPEQFPFYNITTIKE
jgi:hypothetical protein